MAGVVVAVRTERLAHDRCVWGMQGATAERTTVLAGPATATRTAQLPRSMHRPEGRRGQGDEEPWSGADCGGNVLAAEEPCADEVEGVARVEAGAGRADACAPVAAADEEAFAGFVAGVVAPEDLAGRPIQNGGGAGEMDGMSATTSSGDLLQPAREFRVLRDADGIAIYLGELTQARRAVEGGAPVSRCELRGDGGDLPGWAAEAARMATGGALSVMGITRFRVGGRWEGSADGSGTPADATSSLPSRPGPAGSVALAVRAPHARHWHGVSFLLRCGRSR